MLIRVLVSAPTAARTKALARRLRGEDVRLMLHGSGQSLWDCLRGDPVDLLAVDAECVTGSAEAFISDIRALPESPEVVIFSKAIDAEARATFQAAMAYAIIDQAASDSDVQQAWSGVLERLLERGHRAWLAEQGAIESSLGDFASDSPAMREFLSLARKVAASDSTLLLLGETGTGKEYLARAIHAESGRAQMPFVPVHCSALSESLLESELFGHVQGAFTGAIRGRKGYFEMAHRGTLFLDEVGEMKPQTQVKLLRVLQDKRVQPVGAETEIEVDVRLVAATNRDLAHEVEQGRFRADLFYRLSVVPLRLPPLRQRREDIERLFESHVEEFRLAMNKPVEGIHPDALQALLAHPWPGNVRELINVAERAVLLCESREVGVGDLPEEIRKGTRANSRPSPAHGGIAESPQLTAPNVPWEGQPYKEARAEWERPLERRYLEHVLTKAHGRVGDAARLAGLSSRALFNKMQAHGLRKEDFRLRSGHQGPDSR